MKLEIYHEEKETVVEEPVRLRLITKDNGSVMLAVVDKDGDLVERGNLIQIYTDGTFYREGYVSNELGFRLDGSNRIVERN